MEDLGSALCKFVLAVYTEGAAHQSLVTAVTSASLCTCACMLRYVVRQPVRCVGFAPGGCVY